MSSNLDNISNASIRSSLLSISSSSEPPYLTKKGKDIFIRAFKNIVDCIDRVLYDYGSGVGFTAAALFSYCQGSLSIADLAFKTLSITTFGGIGYHFMRNTIINKRFHESYTRGNVFENLNDASKNKIALILTAGQNKGRACMLGEAFDTQVKVLSQSHSIHHENVKNVSEIAQAINRIVGEFPLQKLDLVLLRTHGDSNAIYLDEFEQLRAHRKGLRCFNAMPAGSSLVLLCCNAGRDEKNGVAARIAASNSHLKQIIAPKSYVFNEGLIIKYDQAEQLTFQFEHNVKVLGDKVFILAKLIQWAEKFKFISFDITRSFENSHIFKKFEKSPIKNS